MTEIKTDLFTITGEISPQSEKFLERHHLYFCRIQADEPNLRWCIVRNPYHTESEDKVAVLERLEGRTTTDQKTTIVIRKPFENLCEEAREITLLCFVQLAKVFNSNSPSLTFDGLVTFKTMREVIDFMENKNTKIHIVKTPR